jgi:hypothetical protein
MSFQHTATEIKKMLVACDRKNYPKEERRTSAQIKDEVERWRKERREWLARTDEDAVAEKELLLACYGLDLEAIRHEVEEEANRQLQQATAEDTEDVRELTADPVGVLHSSVYPERHALRPAGRKEVRS